MPATFTITILDVTNENRSYPLEVKCWTTIKNIKNTLKNKLMLSKHSNLHIFQDKGLIEVNNSTTLNAINIDKEGHLLKLSIDGESLYSIESSVGVFGSAECKKLIDQVRVGLERNRMPFKTDSMDSTSGVYFMRAHTGEKLAVFKPIDEEQGMPNNAKGHAGNGEGEAMRPHFPVGEGCLREYAAYLLDADNFCNVPPTTLVNCKHPILNYPVRQTIVNTVTSKNGVGCPSHCPRVSECRKPNTPYAKMGSLQKFVRAGESFENLGQCKFSDFEVQKIALLDMRLLNCDRNTANILVIEHFSSSPSAQQLARRTSSVSSEVELVDPYVQFVDDDQEDSSNFSKSPTSSMTTNEVAEDVHYQLIPIDHGYCLPLHLEINDYDWAWFSYPQIRQPVHPDIVAYIESLDIDSMILSLLQQVQFPEESIFLLRLTHTLIKHGVASGLTLFEIASLIARLSDEPSKLEKAIKDAEDMAYEHIDVHINSNSLNAKVSSNTSQENLNHSHRSRDKLTSIKSSNYLRAVTNNLVLEDTNGESPHRLQSPPHLFTLQLSQPCTPNSTPSRESKEGEQQKTISAKSSDPITDQTPSIISAKNSGSISVLLPEEKEGEIAIAGEARILRALSLSGSSLFFAKSIPTVVAESDSSGSSDEENVIKSGSRSPTKKLSSKKLSAVMDSSENFLQSSGSPIPMSSTPRNALKRQAAFERLNSNPRDSASPASNVTTELAESSANGGIKEIEKAASHIGGPPLGPLPPLMELKPHSSSIVSEDEDYKTLAYLHASHGSSNKSSEDAYPFANIESPYGGKPLIHMSSMVEAPISMSLSSGISSHPPAPIKTSFAVPEPLTIDNAIPSTKELLQGTGGPQEAEVVTSASGGGRHPTPDCIEDGQFVDIEDVDPSSNFEYTPAADDSLYVTSLPTTPSNALLKRPSMGNVVEGENSAKSARRVGFDEDSVPSTSSTASSSPRTPRNTISPLHRGVSFGGLSSTPLYENGSNANRKKKEREQFRRLRRDRRRDIEKSDGFKRSRWQFAHDAIPALISKCIKLKLPM